MGTQDPLVHIDAATLAGGDNNQDRYAYGDGWAFVLDGATGLAEVSPVHDGEWYAERLKTALAAQLNAHPHGATADLVAEAIRKASAEHDSAIQGPCPTSTIALARWDADDVELYTLGDSVAATVASTGEVSALLEDSRIQRIGRSIRHNYRQRLADGHGFDSGHRRLLAQLQDLQQGARNRNGGFWIAGDDPGAAAHGLQQRISRPVEQLVIFSDGLTNLRTPQEACREVVLAPALTEYLAYLDRLEAADSDGSKWARSKLHDDKTVLLVNLHLS